jgi:hypothetical protein
MNKIYFHGTKDLSGILRSKKILCPILSFMNKDVDKQSEKIFDIDYKRYLDLVQEAKKVVLSSKLYNKGCINGIPISYFNSDEQIADNISFIGTDEAYNIYSSYKELARLTHIFLGDFESAKGYCEGINGAVLKLDIPENKLRPGYSKGFAMVKKDIPLEYLVEIIK